MKKIEMVSMRPHSGTKKLPRRRDLKKKWDAVDHQTRSRMAALSRRMDHLMSLGTALGCVCGRGR